MLTTYQYQSEHAIAFDFQGNQLMVNATEMARPFGKQPIHWLRNQDTQEYIEAVKRRFANSQFQTTNSQFEVIQVIQGGKNSGTWLHQKLALRFAQWLSPDFAIWVDERIEELLTAGRTTLAPTSHYDILRMMVEDLKAKDARLSGVETRQEALEVRLQLLQMERPEAMPLPSPPPQRKAVQPLPPFRRKKGGLSYSRYMILWAVQGWAKPSPDCWTALSYGQLAKMAGTSAGSCHGTVRELCRLGLMETRSDSELGTKMRLTAAGIAKLDNSRA